MAAWHRMSQLWSLVVATAETAPELSDLYCTQLDRLAVAHNLALPSQVARVLCARCRCPSFSGEAHCRARLRRRGRRSPAVSRHASGSSTSGGAGAAESNTAPPALEVVFSCTRCEHRRAITVVTRAQEQKQVARQVRERRQAAAVAESEAAAEAVGEHRYQLEQRQGQREDSQAPASASQSCYTAQADATRGQRHPKQQQQQQQRRRPPPLPLPAQQQQQKKGFSFLDQMKSTPAASLGIARTSLASPSSLAHSSKKSKKRKGEAGAPLATAATAAPKKPSVLGSFLSSLPTPANKKKKKKR
jgi:RNase P subunit RPR2